jgi:hypothetical protein
MTRLTILGLLGGTGAGQVLARKMKLRVKRVEKAIIRGKLRGIKIDGRLRRY